MIIFFSSHFAQDESQSQSIELPDFVITGQESISIPKMQKRMSDFIPLLSQDFFTPEFPGNEKTTIDLPEVNTEIINLSENQQQTNARLRFSAGLETWPTGDFYYNNWTGNFIYDFNIFGKNELEYVNKAGISGAGASLGGNYFVDHNSNFLPGLEIAVRGDYYYESFNFFGSADRNLERTIDDGMFDLTLNYNSDRFNNFGFGFRNNYFNKRDHELDENVLGLGAYYKLKLGDFNFNFTGLYKNQVISSPTFTSSSQQYYNIITSLEFLLYDRINIRAGLYFSDKEGNSFFRPNLFGSIKLNDNFSVYGAFTPSTEFKTLEDFYYINRHYDYNGIINTQIENVADLKFAAKFEYEKYFEVSGGVGYLNTNNDFYFEDDVDQGIFSLNIIDSENTYLFLNMLFRKGPFGQFYGEVKLQDVTTGSNGINLPYQSNLLGIFNYSYDWSNGFGMQLGLDYFSESFTDLENSEKIPEQIDLNLLLYYELFENFDLRLQFENLLNSDYYYYRNYKAKPFDVLAGFEFRW